MSDRGEGKDNLTVHTTVQRKEYIAQRAARLKWSKSKFAGAIFDLWFSAGCPNVDPLEDNLPSLPFGDVSAGTPVPGYDTVPVSTAAAARRAMARVKAETAKALEARAARATDNPRT